MTKLSDEHNNTYSFNMLKYYGEVLLMQFFLQQNATCNIYFASCSTRNTLSEKRKINLNFN